MVKVLIADDDPAILDLLSIYMRNEGYDCLLANDGQEALDLVHQHSDIDIALLDIMMPNKTGLEVLKDLRSQIIQLPVIFVSAKQEQTDKIYGLLSGADDYVTKPFEPLEVIARVKSLLRRQGLNTNASPVSRPTADQIDLGAIIIDLPSHRVQTHHGETIKLTVLEYEILILLAQNRGKVFSAEEILDHVWTNKANGSSKTVMVHVSNLRNKISQATQGNQVVQTVWGVGYKIED